MKDREFIELLNLYLDHEISPGDAARLEQEIQRKPERRRTYREYCRMQKACRIVASEFAADSTEGAVVRDRWRALPENWTIVRLKGSWRQLLFTAGGVAAAAVVTLVAFLSPGKVRDAAAGGAAMPVVQTMNRQSQTHPDSFPFPRSLSVIPAIPGGRLNSTLMVDAPDTVQGGLEFSFSHSPGPGLRAVTNRDNQFEWVRQFQMESLAERSRVSLPWFETTTSNLRPDVRAIRIGAPAEPVEDMAAFRFLK